MPDENGFFGKFGGAFIPPQLEKPFQDINKAYDKLSKSFVFLDELKNITKAVLLQSPTAKISQISSAEGRFTLSVKI